jgi:hypothetical protein
MTGERTAHRVCLLQHTPSAGMIDSGTVSASPDGDSLGEAISRKELERSLKSQLFDMPRRRLTADDYQSLDLLNDEVANPPVSGLLYLRFNQ